MFIQSWAERRRLKYAIYNGEVTGYFLDEGMGIITDLNSPETVRRKTTLDLIGVAVGGMHELSFVFNNSDHLKTARRHRLISLSMISNFEGENSYLNRYFNVGEYRETEIYGVYKEGGYTRVLTDAAGDALLFFYVLKRRYLPGLSVSDDYNIFDEIWSRQPDMPREFDEDQVVIPNIQKRWAVGD
jgi:hypothetical protein